MATKLCLADQDHLYEWAALSPEFWAAETEAREAGYPPSLAAKGLVRCVMCGDLAWLQDLAET